eukprot:2534223-Amphidinium_carterae.1
MTTLDGMPLMANALVSFHGWDASSCMGAPLNKGVLVCKKGGPAHKGFIGFVFTIKFNRGLLWMAVCKGDFSIP